MPKCCSNGFQKFCKFLKWSVYLTLLGVTIKSVWNGPFLTLLKDDTTVINTYLSLNDFETPLEMPMLSICKSPAQKNISKYFRFIKEGYLDIDSEKMHHIINETYYTMPEETVINVAIAKDYFTAGFRTTDIKVGPPFVKTVFVDMAFYGFCATISFTELKKYLVAKGEVPANAKDFSYAVIVWLKGSNYHDGSFIIEMNAEDENIAIGADSILKSTTTIVDNSWVKGLNLEYVVKKQLRNCDASNRRLTTCIMEYFDKWYGSGPENMSAKYIDIAKTKFNGAEKMYERTGCRVQCEVMEYPTSQFAKFHRDYITDRTRFILEAQNDTTSSLLIINHIANEHVAIKEEVPIYTAISYLADVGGIVGIFLGMSFWSIFKDYFSPLLQEVHARLR